jgi:hypothetical protein
MLDLVLTFMTAATPAAASTAVIASTGKNLRTAEAQAYRKSGTGENKSIFHKEGKLRLVPIL